MALKGYTPIGTKITPENDLAIALHTLNTFNRGTRYDVLAPIGGSPVLLSGKQNCSSAVGTVGPILTLLGIPARGLSVITETTDFGGHQTMMFGTANGGWTIADPSLPRNGSRLPPIGEDFYPINAVSNRPFLIESSTIGSGLIEKSKNPYPTQPLSMINLICTTPDGEDFLLTRSPTERRWIREEITSNSRHLLAALNTQEPQF